MAGSTESKANFWQRSASVLFKTRGFFLIFAIVAGTGSILAFTSQGQDLVLTVTDVKSDHTPSLTWQIFWLCASVFLLGLQAWFWARVIVQEKFDERQNWQNNWYLLLTPRLLSIVPFALLFMSLQTVQSSSSWLTWVLALLGLGLLVFLWFRLQTVNFLAARAHRLISKRTQARQPSGRPTRWPSLRSLVLYGGLIAALVGMVIVSIDPVTIPVKIGPVAVVLIAAALIIPVLIWLMLLGDAYHIRVVETLIIIAALVSLVVDNHGIRFAASDPAQQQAAIGDRLTLARAYESWRAGIGDVGSNPIPIIFVASAGGASRAGYWTGTVLSKLEEETAGRFSKHVFAISSISGGSLGVAGFLSTIKTRPDLVAGGSNKDLSSAVSDFVGQDYLSPALAGGAFPDLLQRFIPISFLPDRAWSLERGWEVGWAQTCQRTGCSSADFLESDFLSLWSDRQSWTPIWLIGGALQEDGRPILTSSLNFESRIDAWDFHTVANADVRLSTAILNGARFPYVSPAGTISAPGNMPADVSRLHLVDGGYFDAAGVEILRDLAQSLLSGNIVPASDKLEPIFLLITNSGKNPPLGRPGRGPQSGPSKPIACRDTTTKDGCPGSTSFANFAPDMLGPIQGLYSSRNAHGERLETLLIRQAPTAPGQTAPTDIYTLDLCSLAVPMNWSLSANARDIVDKLLETTDVAPMTCEAQNLEDLDCLQNRLGVTSKTCVRQTNVANR
ncbi:FtsH-binding integral membrane protein [Sinorhizobium terangae]|uniref:PNPLA domain-containing protein n=1 Tax=Sinorhizobium terangae TaxID=110322 RepID=A0A6N7LKN5_SINTE|nr:hypothetical protein [Sinorhizobium terangae]MBB4189290.1 FtsH-binding integral membrane protein [Sinorhizobium terangae]MQX18196.1 hypothetical protein [Sinorhizobium terangae]